MKNNIKEKDLKQFPEEVQKLIIKWLGKILGKENFKPELFLNKKVSELDRMMHFISDDGSKIQEIPLSDLLENYESRISHTEYETFEGWIWDMNQCDLIKSEN